MRFLLFIPAFIYLALLVINFDIFKASTEINFFWFTRFELPVVISISIFFILYIILLWAGFNFSTIFSSMKTKKVEKENFDLKTKLLNKQGDLIENIEKHFSDILTKYKAESDKKLELYKKENDKIVSNMELQMKTLGDKISKIK